MSRLDSLARHPASPPLVQEFERDLLDPRITLEPLQQLRFATIESPKRSPFPFLSRARDVDLPMNVLAGLAADRAIHGRNALNATI